MTSDAKPGMWVHGEGCAKAAVALAAALLTAVWTRRP